MHSVFEVHRKLVPAAFFNMKFFTVATFAMCIIGTFAAFTMTEEQAKDLQDKLDCIKETGADIATLLNIKNGIPTLYDDKVNCFAACMLEKFNIMKPDGSMDETVARLRASKSMSQEKVDRVLSSCKSEVGKDKCETGGKILECLMKNDAVPILS
ncbi:general odorant-binding protein 56d isoform X1 [Nasonia vitripennis]|uniref:Uncharacterized protein n=2 Tax=Nasonia vitripennis TaxID=7425 RepID=A0A7M7QTY0_NASVI|nr:general odorant-binding protein 56d isoform X1 [Nasonia vitripennis]XP_032454741.1 general odorant-binding protein 56d isoform X1 [Nasonia vitripennis]XP_032454742.1 general odorant-binding protein 56d isoform X1 [Nasonia vitripennis]XP_032454743.1 general odorant-binding protein 56d isoform X1 [Nasonia vitripennis]